MTARESYTGEEQMIGAGAIYKGNGRTSSLSARIKA